jgi:hypothetical protein
MTHSPLTNGVQITSDSSPRTSRVDRFIVHHAATTSLATILGLFQPGGRTVSANYALGNDGTLILAVDEDRRAWTSSSATWDGRAVTIEVANSVAGGAYPVSDATFDKLARLIADVATRYGFPINDETVLTHQELWIRYRASYATSCPGDLQRRKAELLGKANYYRAFGSTPSAPTKPALPKGNTMGHRQYYARVDNGQDSGEWMIGGVDLFDDPTNDPGASGYYTRPGYWVTEDLDVALRWAHQYSYYPPETRAVRLERDDYIAQQAMLRDAHEQWKKGVYALHHTAAVNAMNAVLDARGFAADGTAGQ